MGYDKKIGSFVTEEMYDGWNANQKRAYDLFKNAKTDGLTEWCYCKAKDTMLYIPEHYLRLTVPKETAIEIAKIGYELGKSYFNIDLGFSQSLVIGSFVGKVYRKIFVILSSQAGKSFVASLAAPLMPAIHAESVSVTGSSKQLTDRIMSYLISALLDSTLRDEFRVDKNDDKVSRAQKGLSRDNVRINGATVRAVSLGDARNTNDNKASGMMGQSAHVINEESGLTSDAAYREVARTALNGASKLDISNPHAINHFYRDMTTEYVDSNTLIVWGDIQTTIEEGHWSPTEEEFVSNDMFKDDENCRRYLLCEFGDKKDECFFEEDMLIDNSRTQVLEGEEARYLYFMGVDSAYSGKDAIECTINEWDSWTGKCRILHTENVRPSKWVQGVSQHVVLQSIHDLALKWDCTLLAIDVGQGSYIISGLLAMDTPYIVEEVYFNAGVMKARDNDDYIRATSNYSARKGERKRAEMFLDLKYLMEHDLVSFTTGVQMKLKDELYTVRKIPETKNGKVRIESKDDIKKRLGGKSTDVLDSVLLSIQAVYLWQFKYLAMMF